MVIIIIIVNIPNRREFVRSHHSVIFVDDLGLLVKYTLIFVTLS